ncbi:25655_t:CDS:2, partial [Gigaspora margarita]
NHTIMQEILLKKVFKMEINVNLNSNIEVEYGSVDLNSNIEVEYGSGDLNSNIEVEYGSINLNSNIKVEYGSVDINSNIEIEYDNSNRLSDEEYNEPLDLYKEQLFKTTKEAYATIETFANSHGFEIRKGRVEKDANNSHEISRTFLYRHAGKSSTEKKSHKTETSGSCKTDCKWKVNIYWKVEYYTLIGKLNASAQYRLLFEKHKVPIYCRNLYNAISKFKRIDSPGDNNASKLLSELLKKKDDDFR